MEKMQNVLTVLNLQRKHLKIKNKRENVFMDQMENVLIA